jgi:alkanesulfonate monooxygenase SsuD/methylene tetrahydromethanopterin reductase-like flavin-dependent oxidoreductase (luciferase family)
MAATVQEISGGRLVLGLGAGWNEEEFRAFGLPFDHRVSRFEESFEVIRGLLSGERVTLNGRYVQAEDAVLLPRPSATPRLMVGSNGPRMLAATLPHVDAWNTWYTDYGNSPAGFAELNSRISEAASQAGRDPGDIQRSACVLVALDGGSGERPSTSEAPALRSPEHIATVLGELAEAGADEVILVADPITERSIRRLGDVVALARA